MTSMFNIYRLNVTAKSNKSQVVWEFIQWTLLSFLCTIARQGKCRTNKNQSLPIDMHWMFSHCSDRDASPNSGLEITGRSLLCLPEWWNSSKGTEGHSIDRRLDRFCPCLCFYYWRQCKSTEKDRYRQKKEREGERWSKRGRETLAHMLAANGLVRLCMCTCVCVCVGGRTCTRIAQRWGLGPGLMRCFRDNARRRVDMWFGRRLYAIFYSLFLITYFSVFFTLLFLSPLLPPPSPLPFFLPPSHILSLEADSDK